MKYMVKCPYCEKTYMVDSNAKEADFACKSCGAQNGKEDIIEKIVPTVKYTSDDKEEDELSAIKSFDISQYEVDGSISALESYEEEPKRRSRSDSYTILDVIVEEYGTIVACVLTFMVIIIASSMGCGGFK